MILNHWLIFFFKEFIYVGLLKRVRKELGAKKIDAGNLDLPRNSYLGFEQNIAATDAKSKACFGVAFIKTRKLHATFENLQSRFSFLGYSRGARCRRTPIVPRYKAPEIFF